MSGVLQGLEVAHNLGVLSSPVDGEGGVESQILGSDRNPIRPAEVGHGVVHVEGLDGLGLDLGVLGHVIGDDSVNVSRNGPVHDVLFVDGPGVNQFSGLLDLSQNRVSSSSRVRQMAQ